MTFPFWCGGQDLPDEGGTSRRELTVFDVVPAGAPNDDQLAEGVRRGETSAFEALFVRYAAPLATFACRYVGSVDRSRDLVHDVFVRIWETREQWMVRGTVRGYLYAAIRNRALHHVDHEDVEARAANAYLAEGSAPGMSAGAAAAAEDPETAAIRAEVAAQVRAALAELPPRARLIAVLRWQDGLGRPDIAEALGISVGTVNKQLTLAARALRLRLGDHAG